MASKIAAESPEKRANQSACAVSREASCLSPRANARAMAGVVAMPRKLKQVNAMLKRLLPMLMPPREPAGSCRRMYMSKRDTRGLRAREKSAGREMVAMERLMEGLEEEGIGGRED